ncbi:MAG: spore protease YyaC [Syntrophomonadaceae bacterium]|nr:spore protease YyaC [Syntrophomonadaceae bacterium]MDD3272374.1 spore protease YyaC [Syntrophomonadaceae bacterium]MDD3898818.1 spore protease YyaC [Syntrophomonadaceae bacterium]
MYRAEQTAMQDRFSCHFEDPLCFNKIEKAIHAKMRDVESGRDLVFLCIGTDRATGDCLGPLVGSRLKSLTPSAAIYGTLETPVHATNLQEALDEIYTIYTQPFIIAVDACLGNADRIGYINVRRGSLKPGTALNKTLPEVGDFHISAVVNVGGFFEHMVLQNTRLFIVYKMADIIAKGLYLARVKFISGQVKENIEAEMGRS